MTAHQFDENADELWLYFSSVIEWVKTKFKVYRREMLGQNWGEMYNEYYNLTLDADKLESKLKNLWSMKRCRTNVAFICMFFPVKPNI